MEKRKIKRIKNKIYELEGLVELMQLRDDKTDEILPLVKSRILELNAMLDLDVAAPATTLQQPLEQEEPRELPNPQELEDPEELEDESDLSDQSDESDESDESDLSGKSDPSYQSDQPEPPLKGRPRPALCLNDRFRFSKALFAGSDSQLNDVLDRIASLPDFETAEDYIYGQLGFEPDDEDVADFMEIIKSYFD